MGLKEALECLLQLFKLHLRRDDRYKKKLGGECRAGARIRLP
jgi:hypothetical protein